MGRVGVAGVARERSSGAVNTHSNMNLSPDYHRTVARSDLPAINDIYNHYVLNSTATYQEEPETIDGRQAWFDRHGPPHPVTVARVGRSIVGWASLSPYHSRSAYRRTVECSVYVGHSSHRRGIGRVTDARPDLPAPGRPATIPSLR